MMLSACATAPGDTAAAINERVNDSMVYRRVAHLDPQWSELFDDPCRIGDCKVYAFCKLRELHERYGKDGILVNFAVDARTFHTVAVVDGMVLDNRPGYQTPYPFAEFLAHPPKTGWWVRSIDWQHRTMPITSINGRPIHPETATRP